MKNNKVNFFNSIIYFFYKYYEGRFDPRFTLFEAKIAFSTLFLLILVVVFYYINYIIGYDFINFILKFNIFSIFVFIAIPLLLAVHIFTLKLKAIESMDAEESTRVQKRGKKNLIIFVIIIGVLWSIRVIQYHLV